jgi:uncharacterized repeat protein (TIGR01451 family)
VALEVSPALASAGGATLRIFDAESGGGGGLDEVNGGSADPVRFWLEDPDGLISSDVTLPGGTADGTTLTFSLPRAGTWILRTVTGAEPISGDPTGRFNDDDNAWRLEATDGVRIAGFASTLQHDGGGRIDVDFRFAVLVDPSVSSLRLRNYDADGGASFVYRRPDGATFSGTTSGNGRWNGSGGVDQGEDLLTGLGPESIGLWTLEVNRWTANNQLILEVLDQDGNLLPITDDPSGNGLITVDGGWAFAGDGEQITSPGVAAVHALRVDNGFPFTDRVNFELGGTSPAFTALLVDAAGDALGDTDGDGRPDTGLLPAGAGLDLFLRVTPSAAAPPLATTRVTAVSALATGFGLAPGTRVVDRVTRVPQLSIVKTLRTLSDPVNGVNQPKAIPGAVLRYAITVTNRSDDRPDRDTVVVTDAVPAGMSLFVGDLDGAGSGPVRFVDGAGRDRSGLDYRFTSLGATNDDLSLSCDGALTWDAPGCPGLVDAAGYSSDVTHLRVVPRNRMRNANASRTPTFTLEFQARVD